MTHVTKTLWVVAFRASCDGATSREAEMGRELASCLVDCKFFCCIRRWPLEVAMDLWRCLEIRSVVKPGQFTKCPLAMARRKVEWAGLKAHP